MINTEIKPRHNLFKSDRKFIKYLLVVLLILTISYFKFGTVGNWPYKIESDGKYYYQFLVSLIYDNDIDFTNNYTAPKYPWMTLEIDHYNLREIINPQTSKPVNYWTIGPAILWTPFFATTLGIGKVLNLLPGVTLDLSPWGLFMQYGVMFASVVYTVAGLWLAFLILKDYFEIRFIIPGLTCLLFGSNFIYYAVFEVSMSHVYDFFTAVLFIYYFKKVSKTLENPFLYAALGATAGLHTLVRTQNLVTIGLFTGLLVYLIVKKGKSNPRQFIGIGIFLATYSLFCVPILLINNYLSGNPLSIPQGTSFLSGTHVFEVLFSSNNGLFSTNPILLLGLTGFIWFLIIRIRIRNVKDNSVLLIFLALAWVAQLFINSATNDWWGGYAFGQRRLIGSFLIFGFGLTYLFKVLGGLPKTIKTVAEILVYSFIPVNIVMMLYFVFV